MYMCMYFEQPQLQRPQLRTDFARAFEDHYTGPNGTPAQYFAKLGVANVSQGFRRERLVVLRSNIEIVGAVILSPARVCEAWLRNSIPFSIATELDASSDLYFMMKWKRGPLEPMRMW